MGHKVFISYKYRDSNVAKITKNYNQDDTVRDYVDYIQNMFEKTDHVYKGEDDGEDLSELDEETIWETLKDRIYDSTLTIVLISPNMKENKSDKAQWIPWEISYSLKEVSRRNSAGNMVTSSSNAILAVVIPDRNNSYKYYIENNNCCDSKCRTLKTDTLFKILKNNMFNAKKPDVRICDSGSKIYSGESSYIISVKWCDFIENPNNYIERAYHNQNSIINFEIDKEI